MQHRMAEREAGTERETRPAAVAEEPELAHHPGPKEYIVVAVVLAIATALEVGLYYLAQYVEFNRGLLIALLLILGVIKFALVVLWFMHLRFDSRLFRRLFMTGLVLAVTVYMIVLVTLGVLRAPELLVLAALLLAGSIFLLIRVRRTDVGGPAPSAQPHR